ncbi:hypothetical protein CK203_108740 [Vitis vinifera]|uniref:Uncharacterized protein n=1 Tax=Vitis vinifera TaxID=29760 RepID=A0A438CGL0_VITVI|nr:hypothetical protein CK203_108740 [Vitis vinifera]
MNFMSYVAEVLRGWDEPNARDMGRVTSQPKAKVEMYILNDGMDMKAKIAAMARRLEELEMKKMQEVQAISQTPLQPMPYSICRYFEHLVEECPTIPTMDEVQNDLSQKIDNLQDSISRFANLNTMQEKENSPSQPHQNQKGIYEMEAKESDKEVDLPTCKLEHKEERETEKEKGEKSQERKRGKGAPAGPEQPEQPEQPEEPVEPPADTQSPAPAVAPSEPPTGEAVEATTDASAPQDLPLLDHLFILCLYILY